MHRPRWFRGAVTLSVAGSLLAVAMLSPVLAGKAVTKKKAKRIAASQDVLIADRVAYSIDSTDGQAIDGTASGDPVVQQTVSIQAPAAGYLVLDGWLDTYADPGSQDDFPCFVRVDGTKVQSSEMWIDPNAFNGDNSEENCISHAVVPVGPGSHMVELVTDDIGNGAIKTREIGISAEYVPFDGNGNRPT